MSCKQIPKKTLTDNLNLQVHKPLDDQDEDDLDQYY